MSTRFDGTLKRATGLLIIETKNSNPNGDPDQEGDPRTRYDDRGIITGVSFKRKLRDLVDEKDTALWDSLGHQLQATEFQILEKRFRDRSEILSLHSEEFISRYWDARLFGNTTLEKKDSSNGQENPDSSTKKKGKKTDVTFEELKKKQHFIRSGVVSFGLGVSVCPVRINRLTLTNKAGVQETKDRGMAPLGYRIVEHGLYCMPFFINPTAALKTGCQPRDVALLLKLIPYAYPHTKSAIRPFVEVRYAWYAEHLNPLGSFSEFSFIEAMTPKRKGDPEEPSSDKLSLAEQYDVPKALPEDLRGKAQLYDLCEDHLPDWCKNAE